MLAVMKRACKARNDSVDMDSLYDQETLTSPCLAALGQHSDFARAREARPAMERAH